MTQTEKQPHTPGPWHWRFAENGQGYEETTLVGSPDGWERCEFWCFGWKEGSETSRGPLNTPGHEHNTAPHVLGGEGWHGSGNLDIDVDSVDACLIAAAPDMLAACEEALRVMEADGTVGHPRAALHKAVIKARGD